jgi:hypothetical protein
MRLNFVVAVDAFEDADEYRLISYIENNLLEHESVRTVKADRVREPPALCYDDGDLLATDAGDTARLDDRVWTLNGEYDPDPDTFEIVMGLPPSDAETLIIKERAWSAHHADKETRMKRLRIGFGSHYSLTTLDDVHVAILDGGWHLDYKRDPSAEEFYKAMGVTFEEAGEIIRAERRRKSC